MMFNFGGTKAEGFFDSFTSLLNTAGNFLSLMSQKTEAELKRFDEGEEVRKMKTQNLKLEYDARKAELEARIAKANADKRRAENAWKQKPGQPQLPAQPSGKKQHKHPRPQGRPAQHVAHAASEEAPHEEHHPEPLPAESQEALDKPLTGKIRGWENLRLQSAEQ